jgi:hypothetical protein
MKSLTIGFAAGAAIASAASALAFSSAGRPLHLAPGQSAYVNSAGEQTTCQAVVKHRVNTFSCFVAATDRYRHQYSVTINNEEVTVSKYLGLSQPTPYRVVFRIDQGPTLHAH